MSIIDWLIVLTLLPLMFLPIFKKIDKNSNRLDRFAGGRSMPWLVLGGSLAATSISPDTPLLIVGAFYEGGLTANWFWLAGIPGTLATLFFFAKYWQRSGVITKVEIFKIRYGTTKECNQLRQATALLDAGLVNVCVLASVIYTFTLLTDQFLADLVFRIHVIDGWEINSSVVFTIGITLLASSYAIISGFKAVAQTDILHISVVILVSILIIFFSLPSEKNDESNLIELIRTTPGLAEKFNLFDLSDEAIWILLLFGWWHSAPGKGLFVQRLAATKNEKHAVLITTLYVFIHYILRAWPWFIIGALALIYFPILDNPESAYLAMASKFLPDGGVGLMLVAFLFAFMSTIDSRLNWGASYFVNDVFRIEASVSKKAKQVEAGTIILLVATSLIVALSGVIESIIGIYKYLLVLQSGLAFAAIARWYWWRMTIWAEIAGLVSCVALGNLSVFIFHIDDNMGLAHAIAFNTICSGVVTCSIACLTSDTRTPSVACKEFHSLTKVVGPGWSRISKTNNNQVLLKVIAAWVLSIFIIFSIFTLIAALFIQDQTVIFYSFLILILSVFFLWIFRVPLSKAIELN